MSEKELNRVKGEYKTILVLINTGNGRTDGQTEIYQNIFITEINKIIFG